MFNLIAAAPAALLLLAGCSAPEGDEDDEDRTEHSDRDED
jgi:protein involved in sex pheromone biosynthesis